MMAVSARADTRGAKRDTRIIVLAEPRSCLKGPCSDSFDFKLTAMQHHFSNTAFARKFRQEYILHACAEELQCRQFLFTRYGASEQEMDILAGLLANKWNNTALIGELAGKLEHHDNPGDYRLRRFTQRLIAAFNSYSYNEPYCAPFFTRVISVLKPFLVLVSEYRLRVQLPAWKNLKAMMAAPRNDNRPLVFDGDEIDALQLVIEQFVREMQVYYDEFQAILQQETGRGQGVQCISRVETYLLQLTTMIERSILNAEATHTMLDVLKMELVAAEVQQLCN
jgi:hypothetical protein